MPTITTTASTIVSMTGGATVLESFREFTSVLAYAMMTRQRIRRGVLRSVADLQAAINAYLAEHNASPKPFVWTKSAEAIMAKLERCPVLSV